MKFKDFINEILEYESDTFSATGESLLSKEAEQIAEKILENIRDTEIDGVWLRNILNEIREEKDETNK